MNEKFENGKAESVFKAVERDLAAELDAVKDRLEKLLHFLKDTHGMHFPH